MLPYSELLFSKPGYKCNIRIKLTLNMYFSLTPACPINVAFYKASFVFGVPRPNLKILVEAKQSLSLD